MQRNGFTLSLDVSGLSGLLGLVFQDFPSFRISASSKPVELLACCSASGDP